MPMPFYHLGAAMGFAWDKAALRDCPEFFLGCIAPDSVIYEEGWTKERKDAVHLRQDSPDRWEKNVLEFVRERTPMTPFETGYAVHLLTDCFWLKEYYGRLKCKFDAAETPMEERSKIHHREQAKLCYCFFLEDEWVKHTFSILKCAEPVNYPPFLCASDLQRNRDNTTCWYDTEEHIPKSTETQFLSKELLQSFMTEAAQYCRQKLL